MQKSHDLTNKKQMIEIIVVTAILGLAILVYDFINTTISFDGELPRNEAGKGINTENLKVKFLDHSQELAIDISDEKLSEKELTRHFEEAIGEIEGTYLGKNKSADKVSYDLKLDTSYLDGLIGAQWKTEPLGIISSEGKLNTENIPDDGEIVNLTAILYYENEERIYSFPVVVRKKDLSTIDGQIEAIKNEVSTVDEATRDKNSLKLPDRVGDIKLSWKKKMDYRGIQIIILGLICAVGVEIGKRRDKKKAQELLLQEKERDYPMIISQLSILMGAGMSFRKALERICLKYQEGIKNGKERRPGYEEIVKTYRKMIDGLGEIQALEDLGKSSESKEYRKLSMMLIQNLRKGSSELIDSLEKEEKYAFEMRKRQAMRAGEEASTKLLLPMGGMLLIVMVILIVPAIMQINI